jgi:hypothetical protein
MTRPRKYRFDSADSATHIESLARAHDESAIRTLAGLMTHPDVSPKDRIRCAEILLVEGLAVYVVPRRLKQGMKSVEDFRRKS